MNAMYSDSRVTSTPTEGRYDWETANVTAIPSTVQSLLAHLNEELVTQKNMIRAIGENLHGKPPEKEELPKQGPMYVLEALEDLADRMNENNLALKTIMNDLGINC